MKEPLPLATFTVVESRDYAAVKEMARSIWPEVYRKIISMEQITYMIERMYAPKTIASEVRNSGIQYHWILKNGGRIGFLAYGPLQKGEACTLHKLYLLPRNHGTGIGSFALIQLIQKMKALGVSELNLRVNRHNKDAIRCYERNGFRKTGEDCLDIGGGHVMDDFLMSHSLMA